MSSFEYGTWQEYIEGAGKVVFIKNQYGGVKIIDVLSYTKSLIYTKSGSDKQEKRSRKILRKFVSRLPDIVKDASYVISIAQDEKIERAYQSAGMVPIGFLPVEPDEKNLYPVYCRVYQNLRDKCLSTPEICYEAFWTIFVPEESEDFVLRVVRKAGIQKTVAFDPVLEGTVYYIDPIANAYTTEKKIGYPGQNSDLVLNYFTKESKELADMIISSQRVEESIYRSTRD